LKRWIKIPLVVLASAVVVLLLAELAASFTAEGNAAIFVEDEQLHLVRKPDNHGYTWGDGRWIACRINAVGLRGEDLPATRDPDEVRVLCVGDSFTFGGGVEEHEAWPQQLQALLGPPEDSGVRVMNGGANGWDTAWHRLYLEARGLSDTDADVVLLGWNWNDLNAAPNAGPDAVEHFIKARGSWLSAFADWPGLRDTHLYRWLYARSMGMGRALTEQQLARQLVDYRKTIVRLAVQPEQKLADARRKRYGDAPPDESFWTGTDTKEWALVRREITAIAALCRERGVTFAVAMLPEPSWRGADTFPGVERFGAMLDALGVPWVDCQPDFNGKGWDSGPDHGLWLTNDPVHPKPEGQALFAERARELLTENDLLRRRD
jgi:lysophospholipase L1-like esterase